MADEKGERHLDTMADSMSREVNERARSREEAGASPGREAATADAEEGAAGGVGAAGGAVAGAAAGTVTLGPVGALIGGLAGGLGGWWTGPEAREAGSTYTEADDRRYRAHYEQEPGTAPPADRRFDDFRAGYWLGHVARRNPAYGGRRFEEIEPELRAGWSEEMRQRYGDWAGMRGYVRAAFTDDVRDPADLPPGAKRRDIIAALRDPLPPGEIRE